MSFRSDQLIEEERKKNMEEPSRVVTSEDLHTTYLDRSRKELQRKIEQLKRALAQV